MVRAFDFVISRFRLPALAVWLALFLFGAYGAPGLAGVLSDSRPRPFSLLLQAGGWAVPELAAPMYEYEGPLAVLLLAIVAGVVLLLVSQSIARAIGLLVAIVASAAVGFGVALVLFPDGYAAELLMAGAVEVAFAIAIVSVACVVFRLALGVGIRLLTGKRKVGDPGKAEVGGAEDRAKLVGRIAMVVLLVGLVLAGSFGLAGMPSGQELGLALAIALVLDATAVRALPGGITRWRTRRDTQKTRGSADVPAGARSGAAAPADSAQPADPWEHRPLEWMHRTLGSAVDPTSPIAPVPPLDRSEAAPPVPEPASPALRKPLALPDRQLTSARLAVLKTATSILTSGGRSAGPDEVQVLAEQLEVWVYRRREPAGVPAPTSSSRPLWQQIATNNGS